MQIKAQPASPLTPGAQWGNFAWFLVWSVVLGTMGALLSVNSLRDLAFADYSDYEYRSRPKDLATLLMGIGLLLKGYCAIPFANHFKRRMLRLSVPKTDWVPDRLDAISTAGGLLILLPFVASLMFPTYRETRTDDLIVNPLIAAVFIYYRYGWLARYYLAHRQ